MAFASVIPRQPSLFDRINGQWHIPAVTVFTFIVIAHLVEHLVQLFQIFALGWARPDSRGVLGQIWPWLISSEWLHFLYAVVMFVGLWVLLRGCASCPTAHAMWKIAALIQTWHLVEHALLFYQGQTGTFFFGQAVPTSVFQLIFPRVELHFGYNVIVAVPMAISMYFYFFVERKLREQRSRS